MAVKAEQASLEDIAQRVAQRAQRSTAQARVAFAELSNSEYPSCSAQHVQLMRRIAFNTPSVEEVGFFQGGRLRCTSWGAVDADIPFVRPSYTMANGLSLTFDIKPALRGGTRKLAMNSGHYNLLMEPVRFVDVIAGPQVQLVLATRDGRVIAALGDPDLAIAQQIAAHPRTAIEGDHAFSAVRSGDWVAIAMEPRPALFDTLKREQLWLLPIGVFIAGLIVAMVAWFSRQRLSFRAEIATGIRKREFSVHYQPIISLETGACVGAEALLRWQRPDGSQIRPDLFVPVAEDNGMIGALTEQVIDHVGSDVGALLAANRSLHIAINLSPRLLAGGQVLTSLARLATMHDILPEQIWLEVTESGLVDYEAANETIVRAHNLGFRLSMDDFGTGYSSLGHLQEIAFDALKIDRSFVATIGIPSAKVAVISHIIELGKALEVAIIAEGVERQDQADALRQQGVGFAQGWLYARAMPKAEFASFLERSKAL